MTSKQINFEGNLEKIFNKNYKKKFFSRLFLEFKNDIKNPNKTLNILSKSFKVDLKKKELKNFEKYKTIVIIGMGGSILGAQTLFSFLNHKIKKKFFFFDNIDENKTRLLKKNKISEILFIIISKSGNTIETISNTFSLNILKKNAKNVIIISEKKNNLLFNLSKKFNLFHIEHKNFIGGRYSVLSEVGLVPAHLMGLNTLKLRSNLTNVLTPSYFSILTKYSLILAYILNSKKYNNIILLNYEPKLEKLLFWFQQLIAESLGKNNKGFLPVISNAPKDHHSLLQLYLDGPKDKIFYIFTSKKDSKIKIKINKNFNEKKYLDKKKLSFIKDAQKKAIIKTFLENKIPFRELEIKKFDEKTIGELFSYFIAETILIGKLSKINPFDQPAVEKVKIYTKNILTKKNQK